MRHANANEIALILFLGVTQQEIRKHSETVYEWRGQYLEVLSKDQLKRSHVPASWYMTYGEWKIREMGKQSAKVQKILKK